MPRARHFHATAPDILRRGGQRGSEGALFGPGSGKSNGTDSPNRPATQYVLRSIRGENRGLRIADNSPTRRIPCLQAARSNGKILELTKAQRENSKARWKRLHQFLSEIGVKAFRTPVRALRHADLGATRDTFPVSDTGLPQRIFLANLWTIRN